jgi:spermidine synthase
MATVILETSNPNNILEYKGTLLKEHTSNLQTWKILQLTDKDEMLFIESQHQSTKSDEYIYHEAFVHSLMCGLSNPKRVLILGGAEGCMAREVLKWQSVEHIRQIDWDASLVEYFKTDGWSWNGGAYSNPKVHVECKEALTWLRSCHDQYDAIFIDLLDPHDEHDLEFMENLIQAAKHCLKTTGGLAVNVGEIKEYPTPACSLAKWMMTQFKEPKFHRNAIHLRVPSYKGEWCFLMATPNSWSVTMQSTYLPVGLRFFTKEFLFQSMFWPRYYPEILQNFWKTTESEYQEREKLVAVIDHDYTIDNGYYGC